MHVAPEVIRAAAHTNLDGMSRPTNASSAYEQPDTNLVSNS